ncbi:hypothetical protein AnaeK_4422 [Anaeromyxobacter sp. K]|uniref:O-antigen polysaccharide polymerase Wzy n=1 Tax=Anaeromyxobacter sp. (strain K) TaxID=447217 RepID=UPI00017BE426|nr:O-antigen polysaccharide polymerase Wzy [Anaeromyxobacter sp. K]ACG75625.1 hypothetical protein AnaeK_4422 [Anaeromyxobacter sp. K]
MASPLATRSMVRVGIVLSVQGALACVTLVRIASLWNSGAGDDVRTDSILFLCSALWGFASWRLLAGRLFEAYPAFLLAFALFSGGQLGLYAVGALPAGPLNAAFSMITTERTSLVVNASLAQLHFGALCSLLRKPRPIPLSGCAFSTTRLRSVGLAFSAVAIPAAIADFVTSIQAILSSGYLSIYQNAAANVGLHNLGGLLAIFLTPGLLILLSTRPESPWNVRFAWAIAIGKALSLLVIGQRGYAVMTLVPMLLVHDRLVRRLNRTLLVCVSAALVILAFPVIRAIRTLDAQERIAAMRGGLAVENPLTNTISEMGGTMGTVAHTIELVPNARPYDRGMGLIRAVSTVVPNLFWERHPGAYSYGEWLTREVAPWLADVGGGLGFSLVAEGYINFGRFGGPLYCGFAGFFLAALLAGSRYEEGRDARVVFSAIVLSVLLFLPRSEASTTFRALAWCALGPYLVCRPWRRPFSTAQSGRSGA